MKFWNTPMRAYFRKCGIFPTSESFPPLSRCRSNSRRQATINQKLTKYMRFLAEISGVESFVSKKRFEYQEFNKLTTVLQWSVASLLRKPLPSLFYGSLTSFSGTLIPICLVCSGLKLSLTSFSSSFWGGCCRQICRGCFLLRKALPLAPLMTVGFRKYKKG